MENKLNLVTYGEKEKVNSSYYNTLINGLTCYPTFNKLVHEFFSVNLFIKLYFICLLYTSPSPRD